MGDGFIDIDLNEEPTNPGRGSLTTALGSLLREIEAHERIEERIRRLRAVIFVAQQHQVLRLPRSPSQAPNVLVSDSHGDGSEPSRQSGPSPVGNERAVEDVAVDGGDQNDNRDCADLVAEALAMGSVDDKNTGKGSFFDCNICLDTASDPILTCCGHLFCWPCFYQLSSDGLSNAKECPVCKGEVADTGITPIYGNGDNTSKTMMLENAGLMVPPRPQARRVESVRQQLVTRGMRDYPIEEAMALFSNRISAIRELHQQIIDVASSMEGPGVSQVLHVATEEVSGGRRNPYGDSELLSSALNSVEGEPDINFSHQRTPPLSPLAGDDRDSFSSIAAIVHSEAQTSDTAPEINSTMPQSTLSSRRRTAASRSTEAGSGVSRGPRRRRLR